jgi:hypothetical protein
MPRRKSPDTPPPAPATKPRGSRAKAGDVAPAKPAAARARKPARLTPTARLETLAERFEAACDSLARSLADVPRPDDFQPLADHLYSFASTAPGLADSLQEVPRAASDVRDSVRALQQLAETLHFAHEQFGESLLRLPRAEDYEPLAAPLAEFARVSPALAESLAEVLRVARPLGAAVQQIEDAGRSLRATETRLVEALAADHDAPASIPSDLRVAVARECMHSARRSILEALRTLPREPAYASLASQLRELATVSPSLMEWLRQTPTLAAPLSESVGALQAAALRLEEGLAALATEPASNLRRDA